MLENKVFFTPENLTPDIDCSLRPAHIFTDKQVFDCEYYAANTRKWQSAPCVVKAGENLFCCFSSDNFSGTEQPNNYTVIMRSADDGDTWDIVMVVDHMEAVRLHEPILWVNEKGEMWHFWAQSYNWWDGRGGVWAMKIETMGDAVIHTAPKRLCHGVVATPPITLANGKVLLPVSVWKRFRDTIHPYPENGESSVYICDADFETCTYVGGAFEKDSTFDENAVVERKDGSLYMIIRCESAITYTVSHDRGKTWTLPQKLMDHISARSFIAKLPSGNYILVTNNDTKERRNMTVFLSTDECETFSPQLLLDERAYTSYPAGGVTANGRVYVTYDYNRYSDEEIYLASFTETDILNGTITEKGSFSKKLVTKGFGGKHTDKVFESGE